MTLGVKSRIVGISEPSQKVDLGKLNGHLNLRTQKWIPSQLKLFECDVLTGQKQIDRLRILKRPPLFDSGFLWGYRSERGEAPPGAASRSHECAN